MKSIDCSKEIDPRGGTRALHGEIVGNADRERYARAERRITFLARLLDDLFVVPGTNLRFGLDPIVGLVPVVGDVASGLVGLWVVVEASRFRVPRIVLYRMTFNVLADIAVGSIPVVGDALDFLSKSSEQNLRLFRRHALDPGASTRGHRLFFLGIGLILLGIAWLAWLVVAALLSAIGGALHV